MQATMAGEMARSALSTRPTNHPTMVDEQHNMITVHSNHTSNHSSGSSNRISPNTVVVRRRTGAPAGPSTKPTAVMSESGRTRSTPPRPRPAKQYTSPPLLPQQEQQQLPQPEVYVENNNNNMSRKKLPPPQQERRTIDGTHELLDTLEQEQTLFEQRLCEDTFGIAVRKINQYGKSSLRYVKCIRLESSDAMSQCNRSVSSLGSWSRRSKSFKTVVKPSAGVNNQGEKSFRVLAWGKKKDVQIALDRFVCVRKGKTTERTRRNSSHGSRVLSLLTDDPSHPSLDIEAPTRLDRDKFARAFARFLQVPMEGGTEDNYSVNSAEFPKSSEFNSSGKTAVSRESEGERLSASMSAPGDVGQDQNKKLSSSTTAAAALPPIPPPPTTLHGDDVQQQQQQLHTESFQSSQISSSKQSSSKDNASLVPVAPSPLPQQPADDEDAASAVSSLTGHGYDQELVEELHHALNDLRAELEESRAEAARAVKVAEQAIQSAERNNSQDWQNTVTHKAAEAAALAQKKSAEAMAKQRLAEERLEAERRTAAFWRKQSEMAEEEAGKLQTRAAAAEVQRAAMEERLESERRLAGSLVGSMKQRFSSSEAQQRGELEAILERNRFLEMALSSSRSSDLESKMEEDAENSAAEASARNRRKRGFGRKKKSAATPISDSSKPILSSMSASSSSDPTSTTFPGDAFSQEQIQKLYAETLLVREKFDSLRRTTTEELQKLPIESKLWAEQIVQAFESSQAEVARLRGRMAAESASRRKLLHEVQDLRGCIRVYCRPTPLSLGCTSILSLPSQDTLVLHRELFINGEQQETSGPMSFEFDRVFDPNSFQQDVYNEVEEVCLGVLDGYNVCVLVYGQTGKGKTHTILGDPVVSDEGKVKIQNNGIQLKALEQLFSIASRRSDRYNDVFTVTMVEVYNERLCDLLAGTQTGENHGHALVAETKSRKKKVGDGDETSSRQPKLEIRTDIHGDTVVQGLLSVEVKSYDEFLSIWEECLEARLHRLVDLDVEQSQYESACHVITTIKVVSASIATGMGTVGKLQFVDLAGADLVPRPAGSPTKASEDNLFSSFNSNTDLCFSNRSLDTLAEVVSARTQFARSVPYRNSTLTHLLRDSLESDTKVLMIACVSSDPGDAQETISTLRFASRVRRVHIGKATKHVLSAP